DTECGKRCRAGPRRGKMQPRKERLVSDPDFNAVQLNRLVARIQAGDQSASDELLRSVCNRMGRLARKMLGRFPDVRRWEQTGDVLQNAPLRLLRALQAAPASGTI